MCGIFFYKTNYPQKDTDMEIINKSLKNLYLRGPDDNGVKITKFSNYKVVLAQTRLKINGDYHALPMKLENLTLLVNGEIYNYKELESKLNVKCHNSDCEILLHLYRFLKKKNKLHTFSQYLDGQYSFVIFDLNEQSIFVARDSVGINSLYLGYNNKSICISSTLKCITDLNENYNIIHFPPNSHLHYYLNHKFQVDLIKKQNIFEKSIFPLKDSKEILIKNKIKNLLTQSVNARLNDLIKSEDSKVSPPDFGVLLSGGLDSSLVAGLVSRRLKNQSNKKLKTFSVGINKNAPDLVNARKVADFIGSEHHEFYITKEEITNNLENVIKTIETFDRTTVRASTAMYLLIKKIKEKFPNIKVLFSGELSDELFCYLYGYNAPSTLDYQKETIRLVENVYQYDALRANKTGLQNSVEIRLPFTYKYFIKYILHLNPEFKEFNNLNKKMEKQILRDSFLNENLIPKDILYRKKEQFSDGVSCYNSDDNMISILKEYTLEQLSEGELLSSKTSEEIYYKKLFNKHFGQVDYLVKPWEPKWSKNKDPSGRVQTFWEKN